MNPPPPSTMLYFHLRNMYHIIRTENLLYKRRGGAIPRIENRLQVHIYLVLLIKGQMKVRNSGQCQSPMQGLETGNHPLCFICEKSIGIFSGWKFESTAKNFLFIFLFLTNQHNTIYQNFLQFSTERKAHSFTQINYFGRSSKVVQSFKYEFCTQNCNVECMLLYVFRLEIEIVII